VNSRVCGAGCVVYPVFDARIEHSLAQTHRRGAEDRRIHPVRAVDRRLEGQARGDIAFELDAGSDFGQREPGRTEPEYASLGDVEHILLPALGVIRAEGRLADPLDEFREFAFLDDAHASISDGE